MFDTYLFLFIFPIKIFLHINVSSNIMKLLASYIRYKALQKDYENYIETLEANKVKSELEMKQMHKELKQYKDLADKQSYYLSAKENTLTQYKEELVELSKQLINNKEKLFEKEENEKELMEKLMHMEARYEELQCSLKVKSNKLRFISYVNYNIRLI